MAAGDAGDPGSTRTTPDPNDWINPASTTTSTSTSTGTPGSAGYVGPDSGSAAGAAPPPMATNTSSLLADLDNLYPWLKSIGLPASWFQDTAASSASDAEVVAKLRMTSQYKARFPSIVRDDGSMRMTEADYLQREDDYRQVLRQAGISSDRMDNPADFAGWFNSEVDPNELKQRVQIYQQLQTSGPDVMDAFYVYAGMRVGIDDLYAATVDPAASQQLTDEYNQKVASQPLDYTTWITRATEAGLSRVASTLSGLQNSGVLTGAAVQSIIGTDPNFARSIMDALYHGGDPTTGTTLNLSELMNSFEYAALGAAATGAGLSLPSKDQIAQIRAAGVDRAAASKAYVDYGQNKDLYSGAVARSGGGAFDQTSFENAAFLGQGADTQRLSKALGQEASLGEQAGQFSLDQNRNGKYVQKGLVA